MSRNYSGAAGGFVTDTPSQFQSSPVKNRIGGNLSSQSLKPMTIKQVNEAVMPHPDSPYQVDGHDLTQVSLVACVRTLKEQSNGSDYLLEDGTGTICGHVWVNERNSNLEWTKNVREGEWVKVYGNLKAMGTNRFININGLHKIEDGNELSCHFLAAINLHLTNTGRAVASKPVESVPATTTSGFAALKSFTPIQQAIHEAYSQSKTDVGVHINSIVMAYRGKYPESDIRSTVNWLMNEGYLYTTIDGSHCKTTE